MVVHNNNIQNLAQNSTSGSQLKDFALRVSNLLLVYTIHMVPGGTDKSEGGDYENRLWHVEFEGLVN